MCAGQGADKFHAKQASEWVDGCVVAFSETKSLIPQRKEKAIELLMQRTRLAQV
jgi:hypothetical protein